MSSDEKDPIKKKRSRRRLSYHRLHFYLYGPSDSSTSLLRRRREDKNKTMGAVQKKDLEDIDSGNSSYNPNYPYEEREIDMHTKTKAYSRDLKKLFSKLSKKKKEQILKARRDKYYRKNKFKK
jgi:hypothetical protein